MGDKEQFLKDQLTKSPDESKKARFARAGLWGIGVIFITGLVALFIKPDIGGHVVLLVQTTLGAWTGIVMLYLGAQGSVDYKTTQVLGNTIEKKEEIKHVIYEEHLFEEGKPGSPERRPWTPHPDAEHEEAI